MFVVIDKHSLQPCQLFHQTGEQDGAVVTVGIWIKQSLIGIQGTFMAELPLVVAIGEAGLHKVEQHPDGFLLSLSLESLAKHGVEHRLGFLAQRGVAVLFPMGASRHCVIVVQSR